jgi:hypothetical protein
VTPDMVMRLREQALRTRLMVLQDAILTHRRQVRDGFVSPWHPDRDANTHLWSVLDASEWTTTDE